MIIIMNNELTENELVGRKILITDKISIWYDCKLVITEWDGYGYHAITNSYEEFEPSFERNQFIIL